MNYPDNEYLARRADLVARADAAAGAVQYAIWDLIAAIDVKHAESQPDPRDAARKVMDACWPDQDARFGCTSPPIQMPIKIPYAMQLVDEPMGISAKRDVERAEKKLVRSKVGSIICHLNHGMPHPFRSTSPSPGANSLPRERCAKCGTTRVIYPDGTPSAARGEAAREAANARQRACTARKAAARKACKVAA